MIDTVNLNIYPYDAFEKMPMLENAEDRIKHESGECRTSGYYKNFYVSCTANSLWLSGSFPKFKNGENLTMLTPKDIEEILQELSDVFHVPMRVARVTRLDVGPNIILDEPVNQYLAFFGQAPRYKKIPHPENGNITYKNTKREIVLYNKILDAKNRNMPIPEHFKDKNVLRPELRFLSKSIPDLGYDRLIAAHLCKPQFHHHMLQLWYDQMAAIQRINLDKGCLDFQNVRCFQKSLYPAAILSFGGQDIVLQQLEACKWCGGVSPKNYTRVKSWVKTQCTMDKQHPHELMQELDEKMQQAVKAYKE